MDQMGSKSPNCDCDHFFVPSLALGSALELLLCPTTELVITGCHIKSSFHHTPQSDQEMIHYCCTEQEKTTLKTMFFCFCFLILVSSWGTHLSSFSTFPIFLKCQTTIVWLTLSSLAISCVVERGSALMIALIWSLSTSDDWPLCFSSSKLSCSWQDFLTQH